MKFYLVVLSILCLSILSCKKERTCTCQIIDSGTTTTRSQSAGVAFSLNIGIPLPIPPITITEAKDTTIVTSYAYGNSRKTTYDKASKKTITKACPTKSEESYTDGSTTIIPGTSTVTVSENGKKTYTCKIE